MRLLITGGSGLIGGSLCTLAPREWEVWATYNTHRPSSGDVRWLKMDLCDPDSVEVAFDRARPDLTIHTAAIADIDVCERNPDLARRTNSDGTRSVCQQVLELGSGLVHISTSNVFDGKRGNYIETDPTSSINVYSESKISAEREALKVEGSLIIRNPIVLGFPKISGRSFLLRTVSDLEEGRIISLPVWEIKTPIDSWTLSMSILELVESGCEGIYHIAGTEALPRYEMGLRIAEKLGCDPALVIPLSSPPPDRAPRPVNATLNTTRASSVLKLDLPDCREAIDRAFRFAGRSPN